MKLCTQKALQVDSSGAHHIPSLFCQDQANKKHPFGRFLIFIFAESALFELQNFNPATSYFPSQGGIIASTGLNC